MSRPVQLAALAATFAGLLCTQATAQLYDYEPTNDAILNTNYQIIKAKNGPLIPVRNGLFVFRNVKIPRGVEIRGVGTNPMIWIVTGDFTVEGQLSVDGFEGQGVDTLNSANFPVAGGIPGAAGGMGGKGSPSSTQRSARGGTGQGPLLTPGIGGGGGALTQGSSNSNYAPGGGGGSFATQGDPRFLYQNIPGHLFKGTGGAGRSVNGPVGGGAAGPKIFLDRRVENDFWGLGFDVWQKRFIVGELPALMGGSGGGGGGDRYASPMFPWQNDEKGGAGGGGGGALVIYSLGRIIVGATGRITANGGHGGGGEDARSCRHGGGGGGGAGGLVVLAARSYVELHVRGETYAKGDFNFCVSADGGVGINSGFGRPIRMTKYQRTVGSLNAGGFGGLGIVQIITRPGSNSDGTNTVLDDGIRLVKGMQTLRGTEKQRYLGWRGWPDQNGVRVDDFGKRTVADMAGDIRPSPVLLPIF